MSTISNGKDKVKKMRKRPAKSSANAATSRAPFGPSTIKELPIPEFIDIYNHFMNGVDIADQLRMYYTTQRIHMKNWKALWHFPLDVIIVNAYKISCATDKQSFLRVRKDRSHMMLNFWASPASLASPASPTEYVLTD